MIGTVPVITHQGGFMRTLTMTIILLAVVIGASACKEIKVGLSDTTQSTLECIAGQNCDGSSSDSGSSDTSCSGQLASDHGNSANEDCNAVGSNDPSNNGNSDHGNSGNGSSGN